MFRLGPEKEELGKQEEGKNRKNGAMWGVRRAKAGGGVVSECSF